MDPRVGQACSAGVGACAAGGTFGCIDGGVVCSAVPGQPATEQCDQLDNDCDGTTDDATGCILTLVGQGGPPGWKDGPLATAEVAHPQRLELGPQGEVYLADYANHAVRRIDPDGGVSTVAGLGRCGYRDGPLDAGLFCGVTDVTVGPGGVLYVADAQNDRIRRISGGLVATIAGIGGGFADGPALTVARFAWITGLHVLPNGDILIVDQDNNRIRRYVAATQTVITEAGTGTAGSAEGTRLAMQLDGPSDVVADSAGNLYVSEISGDRIRFLPAVGTSSILFGSPTGADGYVEGVSLAARFDDPAHLMPDWDAGVLYVADTFNYKIRRLPLDGGSTQLVTGGLFGGYENGVATAARFRGINGLALVGSNWLLSDETHTVRSATLSADFPSSVVSDFVSGHHATRVLDGPAPLAHSFDPRGLVVLPDKSVIWAEGESHVLRRLNPDGGVVTLAGAPFQQGTVNGPAAQARFNYPYGLALGPDGQLYVADWDSDSIRRVDLDAGTVSTFAGSPTGVSGYFDGPLLTARFNGAAALAFGAQPDGGVALFVADHDNWVIRKVEWPNGPVSTFAGTLRDGGTNDGPVGVGRLNDPPENVAAGADGRVYVGTIYVLREISPAGVLSTPPYAPLPVTFRSLAVDGNTLVATASNRLYLLDLTTRQQVRLFGAADGTLDGTESTGGSMGLWGVYVTPEAYWLTESWGNSVRRLWK